VGEGIPRSARGATWGATRGALSELFAGAEQAPAAWAGAGGAECGPDFYARRDAASNQRASVASISSITMGLVM